MSSRALFAKIFGLILALGSCLSIGSEGPLVHTASCLAYFVLRHVPDFECLLQHPNYLRQIYAASTAVGVSSTFNAPVGGVLFSIEVTSTYYLVSNYWRSFVAAVAGIISCNLFLLTQDDPLIVLKMNPPPHQFQKWELVLFAFMGVALGWAAHLFLKVHQMVNQAIRPMNISRPLTSVVLVGLTTALLVYVTGAYNNKSVSVLNLVSDVLNKGVVVEMESFAVPALAGLFISVIVRTFLTLLGTNIPIPAGIFMPVFLIGGLWGRFFGHIIQAIAIANGTGDSIVLSSYALVGATAFCAGVTHTISAAIIAVELTGNLQMLMPCLLVAVIAAGITTSNGLSVYDQGMLNKGLQSLQLLLQFTSSVHHARDVMDGEGEYACVPQTTTPAHLLHILEHSDLDIFPVVSCKGMDSDTAAMATIDKRNIIPATDNTNDDGDGGDPKLTSTRNLIGTISRRQLYLYLLNIFDSDAAHLASLLNNGEKNGDEDGEEDVLGDEDEDYLQDHLVRAQSAISSALYRPVNDLARSLDFGQPEDSPPVEESTEQMPVDETPTGALRQLLPQDARDEAFLERKERSRRLKLIRRRKWQRQVHDWMLWPERYFFGDTTVSASSRGTDREGTGDFVRRDPLTDTRVLQTSVNPLLHPSSDRSPDVPPETSTGAGEDLISGNDGDSRVGGRSNRLGSLRTAPTPTMAQRARYWLQRTARFLFKTDREEPVVYPSEEQRVSLHAQIALDPQLCARLDATVDLLNDPTFHVNLCPFR